MIDSQVIAVIGTSIVAPILAYLKVKSDRAATADKRDTQAALIEKRMSDCEKKLDGLDDIKDAINRINTGLARIEAILEIYIKQVERK